MVVFQMDLTVLPIFPFFFLLPSNFIASVGEGLMFTILTLRSLNDFLSS